MQDGTRISTDSKDKSTILNFKSYDIEIIQENNKNIPTRVIEYNEYNFFELLKKIFRRNNTLITYLLKTE